MIKKYRKLRGYTQEQLAEILDMSVRQIQRIDNNSSGISLETLQNLVNALDISKDDLYTFIKNYNFFTGNHKGKNDTKSKNT